VYAVQYTVHMAVRNPLSRERIVDAAFRLLEQDGWEALSMRRLAQELDVWPMAVYRYFRDKDELVDALVDQAAGTMELPGTEGDWRDRLCDVLDAARVTLQRLPPELRTRLGALLVAPEAGLAGEGVEILESAGFGAEQAGLAWSALGAYTIGAVEIAPTDKARFEYGLDRLLDGLEAEVGAVRR
jgi:AcrR family transcriptional regulator